MSEKSEEKRGSVNSLRNLQKSQLEKLMENPEKPVEIPERPDEWKPKDAPEFVRFYMGSSAGAGSEVFHVYRHLRRRETIRQQYIQENAVKDDLELEFQEKLAKNRIEAEERTSKKRLKRLKKKQRKMEKKESKNKEVELSDKAEEQASKDGERSDSDHEEEESHFVIGGR